MLNHICFEVKPCFTMGVATMAFHLQILMCLPETNSIRLESKTAWFITEFEVSDHKRMDILTNIGLMAMFYFVGSSNLMGLCKKRIEFYFGTLDHFGMRQGDWSLDQHVGSPSPAVRGCFCQPLSFYTTFQKHFGIGLSTFLRSRGSTHRSYWRPRGQDWNQDWSFSFFKNLQKPYQLLLCILTQQLE